VICGASSAAGAHAHTRAIAYPDADSRHYTDAYAGLIAAIR